MYNTNPNPLVEGRRSCVVRFRQGAVPKQTGDGKISGVDRSIWRLAVRLTATDPAKDEEVAMQYVMLIYQGDALERQAALPEEEQKQVNADYQGINQTPACRWAYPRTRPRSVSRGARP